MLVLDSDVLSIIQRGEGEAYEKLSARLMAEDDDVVTTIVTFEEHDATLITRNISDFSRVPELRAYDWTV